MDKVRKFDEELSHICEDTFLMQKVVMIILCGIGMMFMMIPVEIAGNVIWIGCMICASGVIEYMQIYQCVREGNKSVSIYEKLAYMPVTRAEIRKVRVGYLNHFCIRLGAAAFVMQQIMSLFCHSFGVKSVLFAIVWGAGVWFIGWIVTYSV